MKLIRVIILLSTALSFCAPFHLEYVLVADNFADCSSNVGVQYRRVTASNSGSWNNLEKLMTIERDDTQLCNKTAILNSIQSARRVCTRQGSFHSNFVAEDGTGEGVQLRFVQTNHRGGNYNCWGLACDILLINSSGYVVNTIKRQQIYCNDSGSSASADLDQDDEASGSSSGTFNDSQAPFPSNDGSDINSPNNSSLSAHSTSLEDRSGDKDYCGSSTNNSSDTAGKDFFQTVQYEYSGLGSSDTCAPNSTIVTDCLPPRVCGASASVERGFITEVTSPNQLSCRPHLNDTFRIITEDKGQDDIILLNDKCNETQPYIEFVFTYIIGNLDSFDEGFEVSFQNRGNGGNWIPIWFFTAHESSVRTIHDISLGDISDNGLLSLRGYPVNFTVSQRESESEANILICGPLVFDMEADRELFNWRFRWLQTAMKDDMNDTDRDIIQIYNVSITMVNGTDEVQLFQDDASDSSGMWATRRNVQLTNCGGGNDVCELKFTSTNDAVHSREVSTACLNSITQISYTLITASSPDCPDNSSLPQLQYQWRSREWVNLEPARIHVHTSDVDSTTFAADLSFSNSFLRQCSFNFLRFRFIQTEHHGGFCDCWEVANLTATLISGQVKKLKGSCGSTIRLEEFFLLENNQMESWDSIAGFCQDSASVPRIFQTQTGLESIADTSTMNLCISEATSSPYASDCNALTDLRIEVAFDLVLGFNSSKNCDEIDDFHEGVELSVRTNRQTSRIGEWIPLMFFTRHFNRSLTKSFISFEQNIDTNSNGGNFDLGGYNIPYVVQTENHMNYSINICHNDIFQDSLQFRWLQTSYQSGNLTSDVVMLDNVIVRAWNCSHFATLLEDDFDNQSVINSLWWNSMYNVHTQTSDDCGPSSSSEALLFYQQPVNF